MSANPRLKVLIVEDEASQRELLTYNLGKAGYRTLTATNGEEGLVVAREENPALIILDWMMPELSGIELCRQLKRDKETRQTPILMLTARGEESDIVLGLGSGADDYLVKPYPLLNCWPAPVRCCAAQNRALMVA